MQRLPSSVSGRLTTAVGLMCAAGAAALFIGRYGPGGAPFRLFRDSEGVLRFQTRRDVLEQRAAQAWLALQAEPDSPQARLAFGLAQHALDSEVSRLRVTVGGAMDGSEAESIPVDEKDLK